MRRVRQAAHVIAHRGASAYLPEHTLAAKALAYGMGADFLEQDVVVSADGQLVVSHDITLDTVTNVAEVFAGKARADGRFYVRDFTVAELSELSVHERRSEDGSQRVYPGRYPASGGDFKVVTLEAELAMIHGLNQSAGRIVGIYPEIKRPEWHRKNGVECGDLLLEELARGGYSRRDQPVYLQCFDAAELKRLRYECQSDLKLIQLIGENSWGESSTDYDALRSEQGVFELAELVDGVGPWLEHLFDRDAPSRSDGTPALSPFVAHIKAAGLKLHPYTARADDLPKGFSSLEHLIRWLLGVAGVDGVFCDFPDRARQVIDAGPPNY